MTLVVREVVDRVAVITLNRPEQMNALTVALSGELERAVRELGNDPEVNVILIRGSEETSVRAAISTKSSPCELKARTRCAPCSWHFVVRATPLPRSRSRLSPQCRASPWRAVSN